MDIAKAFTFPFDDEDWVKKLLIGVVITFGLAFLSFLLLPLFALIAITQGWQFEIMKRVKQNHPEPLPAWDEWGQYLSQGGVIFAASLIYQIPTVIVGLFSGFVFVLPILGGDSEGAVAALGGIALILYFVCLCLVFVYAIAAGIVFLGGLVRYVDNQSFGTFFQFGDNLGLVRENIGDFGMAIVFLFVGGIVVSVLSATGIGGLVAPIFQAYYSGHILGQLAQKLTGAGEPVAAV